MADRRPLLPLASGVLLAAAFPPLHLVVPSLVALVPLAVWIERTEGERPAFRGGVAYGLVLWLLLLRWLPVTLARFLPFALPGWLLVVAMLSLLTGGVVWAAWRMRHRANVPLWLALPLAWTAGEWVRGNLPASLAFPWLGLGTSLSGYPELVGVAELVGSRGVGFWLALVNGLLASAWVAWRAPAAETSTPGGLPEGAAPPRSRLPGRPARALAPLLAAVVLTLAPAVWGLRRADSLRTRPALRVAVVQTAVPQGLKADRRAAARAGLAALERLLPLAAAEAPDLVVFPEALLPVRLEGPDAALLRGRVEAAVRRAGVPVMVGAHGLEAGVVYNSLFLVRPEGGPTERYDKRRLVPVVERVPSPAWTGGGARPGSFGLGGPARAIPVGNAAVGPLICLESSFAGAARSMRRAGADVLVNPTNDAWLNGRSAWTRLSALWQHPAHLVMRAVETRVGAARAANTGLSLFVDPAGRVHQVIPPFREGVEVRTLTTTDGPTLFVRLGDVAGTGAALLTALLVLASVVRRGPGGGTSAGGTGSRDPQARQVV